MSSLNLNGLSFTGLSSGIDTNAIVDGLLKIQQKRIQTLQDNGKQIAAQQGAFQGIESKLLDLQTQAARLSRTFNGVFDARIATPSDSTLVRAAASASASPGVYNFTINRLAQAQQIASQGFDDPASAIAQGTFQLRVGSGATTSITIDSSNNSLQGLVNAINNTNGDVSASIINDGSDTRTQPFRLLLTAKKSGAANAISISFTPGSGGGYIPEFNATTINNAVTGAANTSTAEFSSNAGSGAYTGTGNNTYTFTVASGGTVGTDAVTLDYTDATGANHGTIVLNASDANTFKTVAQGLQIKVAAGQLNTGDSFTVDAFVPNVQQATDSSVTIGSGAGALTVTGTSNQVNSLIPGVSLNLLAADPNRPVSVTVTNDTDKAKSAIEDFVSSYNAVIDEIHKQTKFDATTQVAGLLLGNGQISTIENQLSSSVTGVVAGLGSQINRLSTVGITLNNDGTLKVDEARLDQALTGSLPGVPLTDLKRLFGLGGQSTNNGIQFVQATSRTVASANPYQVNITQAATQGSFTATNALANSITIDNTNNTLKLSVNGRTSDTFTLTNGSYTPLQLAQRLQSEINAQSSLTGNAVTVALTGGKLQLTSQLFGSNSSVAVVSGTALSVLGLSGTETGTGQNVAGSFAVNGVTEAATGSGQLLTGNAGNAHTSGLAVSVTLSATQVQGGGGTASLTVTRGLVSSLDLNLSKMLDPITGRLKTIDKSFQNRIDDINKQITRDNQIFSDRKDALLKQFAAMEAALSTLKAQGEAIAAQFGSLNGSSTQK